MFPKTSSILIVDDHANMTRMLRDVLVHLGYSKFTLAENGKNAFEILETRSEAGMAVDLIFSDWFMPEMTGLELLEKVRASDRLKDLPFIMVTAHGDTENVVKAMRSGTSSFIVKPFSPATLKGTMEKVWNQLQQKKAGK